MYALDKQNPIGYYLYTYKYSSRCMYIGRLILQKTKKKEMKLRRFFRQGGLRKEPQTPPYAKSK